jgi:uncharacterized delta-60 repeat protein
VTRAIAEMSDGRVVLVGDRDWEIVAGSASAEPPFIFSSIPPLKPNGSLAAVAVASDDSFYLVGAFNRVVPDLGVLDMQIFTTPPPHQGVCLVNKTGQYDLEFKTPPGDFVGRAVVVLPSGKVLVGGSGYLGSRKNLIRLNADGSLDNTFRFPEPNGTVNALALQADGKVVIGGEFTNLGQAYVPGPLHVRYGAQSPFLIPGSDEIVAGSEAGLCRMTAEGTLDASFGNPGFCRVTSLAAKDGYIAVGGSERRSWLYRWLGYPSTGIITGHSVMAVEPRWPYAPRLEPAACLLADSGQVLASEYVDETPTAVAMLPGRRMLVAANTSTARRPSVDMIQIAGQASDSFGLRVSYPFDVHGGLYPSSDQTLQRIQGDIHALLTSADGKVLVGGAITSAHRTTHLHTGESYESEPAPINGLAELDYEGFYNEPLAIRGRSDGLSLVTPAASGASIYADVLVPAEDTEFAIDGPHAADFTWADSPEDGAVRITCIPSGSGPRRAVLHVSKPGTDNAFDIGLQFEAQSSKPDGLVVESLEMGELEEGDVVDFGYHPQGKSSVRVLKLLNRGTRRMEAFPVRIQGDTQDFVIERAPKFPIRAGGESAMLIRYKPGASSMRARQARLLFGESLTPGLAPMTVLLTGSTTPHLVFTQQPADTLLMQGSPLSLTAAVSDNVDVSWKWSHNGNPLRHATTPFYAVAAARLRDAGVYVARAENSAGPVRSSAARVAVVVPVTASRIRLGAGKVLMLSTQAAGDGLRFAWLKDNVLLSGQTQRVLKIRAITAADAGTYSCRVSLGALSLNVGSTLVQVVAGRPTLSLPGSPLNFKVGEQVSYQLRSSSEVERWSAAGLPPGLLLHPFTGLISGRPTRAGNFSTLITASNLAGSTSGALQMVITALPPGVVGYYAGGLSRGATNEELGGALSFIVTSSGVFTAKARSGLRQVALKGTFSPSADGATYHWSGANPLSAPGAGQTLHATLEVTSSTILLGTDRFNDDFGNALRSLRAAPPALVGSYAVSSAANAGEPSISVSFSINSAGAVAWTSNISDGPNRVALSGSTALSVNLSHRLFGTHPAVRRTRSLTGEIQVSDAPHGFLEFGNNLNAETDPTTGNYFHSWDVSGSKVP